MSSAPDWTVPVMRLGYSARAAVYVVLGGLTLAAALWGGDAQGTTSALATLKGQAWGVALLWLIGIGFWCYAAWRLTAAAYDLENRGDDTEGGFARMMLAVTGIIHAALGVAIVRLAMGSGGSGGGASDWTATVMQLPFGKWLAVIAGLGILGAGVHYVLKGYEQKYKRHIEVTDTTRKLDPALRAGFVVYGVILAIVGFFLTLAAWQSNPEQAMGLGGALDYIRSMTFGRILLGVAGLGLLGFALENAVEARYRVVEGADDVETLASRATG